jgi:hypothetical protein
MEVAAAEMYEVLNDVKVWMESLDAKGITNDDLYTDITNVLKKARGL